MNKRILILNFCLVCAFCTLGRTVTDMAGRKVTIPNKITRILPHDDKTAIFLFPYLGSRLIGRGANVEQASIRYISPQFQRLPVVDINAVEEVLKAKPDILIAGLFLPEGQNRYIRLSETTGIPLIIVDLNLMKLGESYRFLSQIFGETANLKSCLNYLQNFYKTVKENTSGKPQTSASVYLSVGEDGLMTAPSGSKHAQVFDLLNIRNVAQTNVPVKGFFTVSIEQVLLWKPDYIFTVDKGTNDPYSIVTKNALWKTIPAVQKKQVIHVPEEPYNWFGNPPSINRVPGMYLLLKLFYKFPEAKYRQSVREFYRVFYHYPLTDAEFDTLLGSR
jgi:iron complex transport system substrate-binding protein